MKLLLWFRMWSKGLQLDAQLIEQRECREDLKELALKIIETRSSYEASVREYFSRKS